jgi:hypothetical protein
MSYTAEQVAKAKTLLKTRDNVQWELGDLAIEVAASDPGANVNGNRENMGVFPALMAFAQEIDVDYSRLQGYRSIALAWPQDKRRADVSYTVHRDLARRDDRFTLVHQQKWNATTLRQFLGQPAASTRMPVGDAGRAQVSQSERAAIAREYVAENPERFVTDHPELARRVVTTSGHLGRAAAEREQVEAGYTPTKPGDDLAEYLAGVNRGLRQRLAALNARSDVASEVRGTVAVHVPAIRDALGWMETWAEAGSLAGEVERYLAEQEV